MRDDRLGGAPGGPETRPIATPDAYDHDRLLDLAVVIALVGSFSVLTTAHVALAAGLCMRRPRWRGPVSLIVPPLAPYWGLRAGMRARGWAWLTAAVIYAIARVAASF